MDSIGFHDQGYIHTIINYKQDASLTGQGSQFKGFLMELSIREFLVPELDHLGAPPDGGLGHLNETPPPGQIPVGDDAEADFLQESLPVFFF
jgi:hypothetical protein